MLEVLSVTGVVFILIAIGYLSVCGSVFSGAELATFGKYVINFALPALIFRAVSGRPIGEVMDVGYIGAYLLGSLAIFVAGYSWSRRGMAAGAVESTFDSMGMSCANSGFVGYPILLMAMPAIASTALALNMIVENLIMIPLVLILAERAGGEEIRGWTLARQIAGRLIRNPIVLALSAGLAVSALGLPVPDIISEPVDMIAMSSAAISLLVIGGTLAGLPLGAIDARVPFVVAGKLLLHPLFVWLGLLAMASIGLRVGDDALAQGAILLAAMPTMTIYPILAGRYGQRNVAALAMLVMTVLSFLTISAILWMLDSIPVG